MLAPWMADSHEELGRAELERRAGRALDVHATSRRSRPWASSDRAAAAGSRSRCPSWAVGLGLLDLGYPIEAARAAAQVYAAHGRAIAEELYELFRTRVWPVYKEQGVSPERIQEVVERLKPLSISSLVQAYEAGMDETRRANIAKRAR